MTRKVLIFLVLLSVTILAAGCDFFRTLAGRPDSKAIAEKKMTLEAKARARKAQEDSLHDALARHAADSAAAADSISKSGEMLMKPSTYGGLSVTRLPARYYIIVGAFSVMENAERQCRLFTDRGYPAEIIAFRNGYNAVGVCRTDDLSELYASLKELKGLDFCPDHVWILSSE